MVTAETHGPAPRYYVAVFTEASWDMFLASGARTIGFRSSARRRVEHIQVGDRFLCYVVNVGQFVGLATATSSGYWTTDTTIWGNTEFPVRIDVTAEYVSTVPEGVPAAEVMLTIPRVRAAVERAPGAWGNFVRGSPRPWPADEALVIVDAIRNCLGRGAARRESQ